MRVLQFFRLKSVLLAAFICLLLPSLTWALTLEEQKEAIHKAEKASTPIEVVTALTGLARQILISQEILTRIIPFLEYENPRASEEGLEIVWQVSSDLLMHNVGRLGRFPQMLLAEMAKGSFKPAVRALEILQVRQQLYSLDDATAILLRDGARTTSSRNTFEENVWLATELRNLAVESVKKSVVLRKLDSEALEAADKVVQGRSFSNVAEFKEAESDILLAEDLTRARILESLQLRQVAVQSLMDDCKQQMEVLERRVRRGRLF